MMTISGVADAAAAVAGSEVVAIVDVIGLKVDVRGLKPAAPAYHAQMVIQPDGAPSSSRALSFGNERSNLPELRSGRETIEETL